MKLLLRLVSLASVLAVTLASEKTIVGEPEVITKTLANGSIEITTHTNFSDGSKRTKVETTSTKFVKKYELVEWSAITYNFDNDVFVLDKYSKTPPTGYVMVTSRMLSEGLWAYFAAYYSQYHGVWTHEHTSKYGNVCIASNHKIDVIYGTDDKIGPTSMSAAISEMEDKAGDVFSKLCQNKGTECFGDATGWREDSAITFPTSGECRYSVGLYVKITFLIEMEIYYKIKPTGNCKEEGVECPDGDRRAELREWYKITVYGAVVMIYPNTFYLGYGNEIDESKYKLVTKEMFDRGLWAFIIDYYRAFNGIQMGVADMPVDHICLMDQYLIDKVSNRQRGDWVQWDRQTKGNSAGRGQFCGRQVGKCWINAIVLADEVTLSVDPASCSGNLFGLYIRLDFFEYLHEIWEEEKETTVVIIDTDADPTDAPGPGPTEDPTDPQPTEPTVTEPTPTEPTPDTKGGPDPDCGCPDTTKRLTELETQIKVLQYVVADLQKNQPPLFSGYGYEEGKDTDLFIGDKSKLNN